MQKKILIIEDDQIVANIYRNKFSIEGYTVETAHDGEAGLNMIRSFKPDAVILDLMLPKMGGVDVMKKLRAEPEFKQLPVIVFSNTYLTNMVQEAWKAGATKCLSKANCTPKEVLDVLRTTLTRNGSSAPNGLLGSSGPSSTSAPAGKNSTGANSAAPGSPAGTPDPDAEFQAELRKTFLESLPGHLNTFRAMMQSAVKSDTEEAKVKQLQELYRRVHALTANAGIAGQAQIAQMADALEALLKELYEKPKNLNASTMRTVATGIDFLGTLFEQGNLNPKPDALAPNILVVDDEAISRRAITYALERAKLKSVSVESSELALNLLTESKFDLVFLDVDMPGMNGFELCTKIRTLPMHKKTPIVFVTSLNDFENRANSTMSGGNDFIAKPFLFIELAVKALIYALRALLPASNSPAAKP
jgi:DNA-binding response OmpR family regulator